MLSLIGTYWVSPAGYSWIVESEERDDQYRDWVTLRNLQSGDTIERKRDRMLNHESWVMTTGSIIKIPSLTLIDLKIKEFLLLKY